mmetsp:Transcript_14527/g.19878  ORF Transcript_14527/g.19878 Transcript_14527/m.19878 type:complete len:229 (+) Transcript_14527:1097-1783(+)
MIPPIHIGIQQCRRFCIRPCHNDQGHPQNIRSQPCRDQAINVLLRGHQNLPSHMAALLGARLLVFQMYPSSPSLDKELGELHDSGEPAVARVCIRDYGSEVVGARDRRVLRRVGGEEERSALLVLSLVVVQLRPDELVYLVGDGVHGVVGKVWAGVVGGGCGGAALPAGDVDGGEGGRHLDGLDWVQGSEGVRVAACGVEGRQQGVQLLGREGAVGRARGAGERVGQC